MKKGILIFIAILLVSTLFANTKGEVVVPQNREREITGTRGDVAKALTRFTVRDADVTLDLTVDSYFGEASWNLWDAGAAAWYYGTDQVFTAAYENVVVPLTLPDGPYEVWCWDTYGDGGIAGIVTDVTGTLVSWGDLDYTYEGIFGFDAVTPFTCTVDVTCDSYPTECSWNVWDYQTSAWYFGADQLFSAGFENQVVNIDVPLGDYAVYCWDTYGDGGIGGSVYDANMNVFTTWGAYDYVYEGIFNFTYSIVTATPLPYAEDFEGGVLPAGWSQEYVVGTVDWTYQSGGHNGNPAAAHGGAFNALFYTGNYNGETTKLVSPQFDLMTDTEPVLRFWHTQANWVGDQDVLRVYYKDSTAGPWTLLAEYLNDIPAWVEEAIVLPNPTSDYYIAFEGFGDYGYGVCLDDVSIAQETMPYTVPFAETFDGATVPADWIVDPIVAGDSWEVFSSNPGHGAAFEHTGNGGNFMGVDDSSPETVPAHLYMPPIDLTGVGTPYLTFYYWIGDAATASTLNIDIDDGTTLTPDVAVYVETIDHWAFASIDLGAWVGQTITVDFRAMESTSFYGDICLDDVEVIDASIPPVATTPVYPPDLEIGVPIITDLIWNAAGFADGYYLFYGTDNPPTNMVNGTDLGNVTSYDHPTDLAPLTTYYWQIVPWNAFGSATACPVWSFETGDVETLPLVEDFETGAPAWTMATMSAVISWEIAEPLGLGTPGDPLADHSDPGILCAGTDLTIDGNYENLENSYIMTPLIDCTAAPAVVLNFWRYLACESGWDEAYVEVSIDGGGTWIDLGEPQYVEDVDWTEVTIDVSTYAAGNYAQFRWRIDSDSSVPRSGWNLDDVNIYVPPLGDLNGYVYEFGTTNPIDGAEIVVGSYVGNTDATGYYEILNIIPDVYDATASHVGYFDETVSVTIVDATVTSQDFYLGWAEILVDPIAVNEYVDPGATMDVVFTVTNNGPFDLAYNPGLNFISDRIRRTEYRGYTGPVSSSVYAESTISTNDVPRKTINNSDAMWDLQFAYDVDTPSGLTGLAGAETDGTYLYATKWSGTVGEIVKFNLDGTFVETFTIPGVMALRDLAYDGTYFYGSNASSYIWEMDFDTQTLISTITTPTSVRAIAYDSDLDGFWYNNFSSDLIFVDRTGTQLNTIPTPPSMYGCAYDNLTAGGPYLWIFTGTSTGGGCQAEQYDLNTLTLTAETHSIDGDLGVGAYIAGGMFLQPDLIAGTYTLGGLAQGSPDLVFGYELGVTETWLSITDPGPGIVVPGGTAQFTATLDATDQVNGDVRTGEVIVSNNAITIDPVVVPVTMNVGAAPVTPDVIFSEYIEGSSNNKALEVWNNTGGVLNLDDFRINQSVNGGGWQYQHYFPAGATVIDQDVWVIITDTVDPLFFDPANADEVLAYPSVVHHNGDDARGLEWTPDGGTTWILIDVIGIPTEDPGSGWDVAGVPIGTQNHTLVRKANIMSGNTDWLASAGTNATDSEWIVYDQNTFDYLGEHPSDPPVLAAPSNVFVDALSWLCTWNAPPVTIYTDDLESYTAGDYLAVVSADWTTWSNLPGSAEDALISNAQALSGTNSVVVEGTSDLVLIMDNYTSGVYSMELNLLVPAGNCGYWNLQKTNTIGQEWAFQIQFDVTGIATADAGAAGALTFPFSFDTWINMELVIDLDADWCDIYVDGALMHGYQWTLGTFGTPGLLSLGGMNLYAWASAGNNAMCYFDDITLSELSSDTRDLIGYNVYLNGTPEASVGFDVFEYQYTNLTIGNTYFAGVSALYTDGESDIVEYEFIAEGAVIDPPTDLFVTELGYATWLSPVVESIELAAKASANFTSSDITMANTKTSIEDSREFLGFNVYLDGVFEIFTTDEFYDYDDGDLNAGQSYLAEVTAVYDEGESVPVDYTFIYQPVTLDPPTDLFVTELGYATWLAPSSGGAELFDDFEAGSGNWNIIINSGTGEWIVYSEPYPNVYTLPGTSTGNVIAADSDEAGSGSTTDTTLELAVPLNFSGCTTVTVEFDNDFNAIDTDDYCYVDVSSDGGITWDNALTFAGVDVRNTHEVIDITAFAAGQASVLVRFVSVQPGWDWWWAIDNVHIHGTGDIGDGLDTKVAKTNVRAVSDTKVANNEDSREFLGFNVYLDGVFEIFTTDEFYDYDDGDLNAGQSYLAEVTAVYDEGESVPIDYTFIYDGGGQPIIVVTPMSINETLEPDEVVVVPVTIENTGTADLTFEITIVETSLLAGVPAASHLSPIYDPANAESDPMIVELVKPNLTDDLFDLQFQYDCYDAGGEAGIETDGNFIYVPLWNGSDFLRYNMDGTFVEYFSIAGVASVRDLAYDGQYFYGAAANNSLFEMDFTPGAEVLVSTITAPVSCRAVAYDDGADGFWANNWSDTITLFDRSGAVLNTLIMSATYISYYGFAYDDFSDGGPFLWGFSQSVAGGILVQYDIAAGGETGVVFDVGTLVGSVGSAGGMFIADGIVPGFSTIGCMVQNEFIVGLELSPGDEPWISVTPLTGTVPAGTSVVVEVTLDATDLFGITKTADLVIANNAGDDVIVDVTMIVGGEPPIFDPPTNVAVDNVLGIVTWDPPAVSGVIIEDNFDSYTVGDYIGVVGDDWTTWSGTPGGADDALVTDVEASSPSNSVVVEVNQDIVLIMDDYTSGIYTYEMKMFVPTGYCGYFNIQNTNVPGTGWAFQIYFQTDGTALADAGAAGALTYAFNHDEWMELKIVIDLDSDWAIYYHDGVEMIGYQYSLGTFGGGSLLSFGGVNIFGGANSGTSDVPMFYFDDVLLSSGAVATRELTGYNVYLDDMIDPVATVGADVFEFTYSDLVFGQDYIAGVSAVYDDPGESIIIEVPFNSQVVGGDDIIIAATKLNGNYPNPFNPVTTIAYSIRETGKVTLQVYNIKGQLVKTLVNDVRETGNYTVTWNSRDNSNKTVASGVYFYKMKAQNYNNTKKMILMK